ncbi:UdgX family uracil-DNA binding protein [Labedaea rhizosphaerae]|uniref:Type-4 uracil-DNA glycosylase n=1 Tax=Labedaea rhizosphaerae TaxID=598644 RepID=A0A4R6SH82_LABRH|nr:UdgX family uracil-DNA binding protein [Labedaea rhizosphaerae]TDQ00890.1 DNA polymerase [Labedaea rhizosphaerae]
MAEKAVGAEEFVPSRAGLPGLRKAAHDCRGCPLYQDATDTVFGEGPSDASVVLVGEQPGDREDREGHPFVGPAGRLLDRALEEAGIDREAVYITNAVKHFKWKPAPRGKRRIHQTPSRTEVVACRPWLLAELDVIEPEVVVVLGATAAKSVMGPSFTLTKHRGERLEPPEGIAGQAIVPTVHPSAVLRAPDRDEAYEAFVTDLRAVAAKGHRARS